MAPIEPRLVEIGSLADFAQHFLELLGRTLTGKLSAANIRGTWSGMESGIEVHLQDLVLDSYSLGEGDIYGPIKNRLVVTRGKWETSYCSNNTRRIFDPAPLG